MTARTCQCGAALAPAAMELALAQVKTEVKAEDVGDEGAISWLAGLGLPEPHASARTPQTPAGPVAGSAAADDAQRGVPRRAAWGRGGASASDPRQCGQR